MKLVHIARMIREKPLRVGTSEIWISKKGGGAPIRCVFLGLGATGELLEHLRHNPKLIPEDSEEGEIAYFWGGALSGARRILVKDIEGVEHVAEVLV